MRKRTSAFTLIEMAVVMAIIGLIIGGIMGGQSLLRASAIRSVTADMQQYTTAFHQFVSEYKNLPGDMPTATTYWGAADGGTGSTAGCYSATKTSEATCNGNGDANITAANPATAVNDATEVHLAWQHLANAGLITGQYTGVTGTAGGYNIVPGQNAPAGRIPTSTYTFYSINSCYTANATYFDGCYGSQIYFGGAVANYYPSGRIFSGTEFYTMDKKVDDGKPGYGQFRVFKSLTTCAVDADNYLLTQSSAYGCRGFYNMDQSS